MIINAAKEDTVFSPAAIPMLHCPKLSCMPQTHTTEPEKH